MELINVILLFDIYLLAFLSNVYIITMHLEQLSPRLEFYCDSILTIVIWVTMKFF